MERITAAKAREITEGHGWEEELSKCMSEIENAARGGKKKIGVYRMLKSKTVKELESLGYTVTDEPSISKQKDGLYHMVYWNRPGELA